MTMEQTSNISFLSNSLVWHPSVLDSDGSLLSTSEIIVADSPSETSRTVSAFMQTIERHGGDAQKTLSAELDNLRDEASRLSDVLRESRSSKEASENGTRLKNLMQLRRLLESYYFSLLDRRTGTAGD